MRPLRTAALALLVGCSNLLAGCTCAPTPEGAARRGGAPADVVANVGGEPGLVAFVVLDTVRADHTSLCGYARPTTPFLQTLVARGAAHTCGGVSPAPWTLPSHASYFTGTSVTEHATMFVAASDVAINATITARPLHARFETLAETFQARGYQTVMVSANSILNEASGLQQGFDHVLVSPNGASLRGPKLAPALTELLGRLDDRPVFLFLNLYDAHDPYPPIPARVDWAPAQPRVVLDAYTHSPDNPYYAFIKGLMPEAEQGPFLRRLTDGYDMGVLHADRNLQAALGVLRRAGRMGAGVRLMVTSDHGEFLGEHGKLRHSGFIWEPGVRVPVLFEDTTRAAPFTFPEGPFSAIHAYHLVRDGALPDTLRAPEAVSEKNPADILVGTIAGGVWRGTDKLVCVDGERAAYDLATDPGERAPRPVGAHPAAADLDALCADVDALHTLPPPGDNAALTEALEAMGYVDPGEP